MYDLKIITEKNIWNDFIINSGFEFYSFVDSFEWGEFNILEGNQVFRYGIYLKTELVGVFQLIKVSAKRGTYFFTPHGPLIKDERLKTKDKSDGKTDYFNILGSILPQIKEIAKTEKCSFVRLNTTLKNTKINESEIKKLGFISAPMHIHAEDTHLLNLEKSEEELLNNIDRKDRYLITRAEKEGVNIKIEKSPAQIKKLIEMHQNHSKRENGKNTYKAFSKTYINNLYKVFDKDISTISAEYEGKIESILMTIKFGKTCVYYIAASDIVSKKFSPNYLCQWEAIKNAKNNGCNIYNFWGVSPDDNPKHPIAGVTKFKRKFGGYDYSLLHAQDLVISNKYWLNYFIETFRRIKRGYYYKKVI